MAWQGAVYIEGTAMLLQPTLRHNSTNTLALAHCPVGNATRAARAGVVGAAASILSPARARLAESWYELDLPETAAREFLTLRRQNKPSPSKLDQLQISPF